MKVGVVEADSQGVAVEGVAEDRGRTTTPAKGVILFTLPLSTK
jgi:hypothetical protein